MESCHRIVSVLVVLCLYLCVLLAQVQHGHLVDGDGDEVLDTDLDLYVNLERSSWGIISRVLLRERLPIQEKFYARRVPYFMDYKLPAQKELSRLNKYPAVEEILVLGAAVTNNIEWFYSHYVSLPKAEQGAK